MATDRPLTLPGRAGQLVMPLTLLVALAGCVSSQTPPKVAGSLQPAPAQPHVRVDGAGLLSDDVQRAALTPEELVTRVDDLLAKDRPAAARHLIERYPDVALKVLPTATYGQARTATFQTIARVFDQQCVRADPGAGWLAVIQQHAEHSERFTAYDAARNHLAMMLNSGHPKEAAALSLPAPPKGPAEVLLSIDSDQLRGKALLQADRAAEAVKVLTRAAKASLASYPYQAVLVLLALSEAHRRAGQEEEAITTWRDAVELAAGLLAPPHPVNDPILWEHLAALRPMRTPWPPVVERELTRRSGAVPALDRALVVPVSRKESTPASAWSDEALIWTELGRWRSERGESQAALLAFKRAEGLTAAETGKEHLRLAQVHALVQLGQNSAAMEILVRLAFASSPAVTRPALATLGTLKFQEGHVQQSLALLKKAVEEDLAGTWPGRSEAEADLGLAYLTTGEEADGLRWLHAAQQHFEQANDRALLRQCLENEAAYQEHTGRPQEAAILRQRERQVEGEE